jgi:tRNA pseudouridine38-40 synthase
MRVALVIEYDGTEYHGWQEQTGLNTIQSALEYAISSVANHEVKVVCAGRTDTGVHATHQVIHFDSHNFRNIRAWIYGVNSALPKDICVKWGKEVSDDFHARYKALSRTYRYIIFNSAVRPALLRSNLTWQYRQLDSEIMHKAAQDLVGEHDFTSFRSVECQSRHPHRRIMQIAVTKKQDLVMIDITANAFLHHMVRNIAGVLITIGSGRKPLEWAKEVLLAKDRRMGAETAPPYGLYLVGVTYPREFNIDKNLSIPLIV